MSKRRANHGRDRVVTGTDQQVADGRVDCRQQECSQTNSVTISDPGSLTKELIEAHGLVRAHDRRWRCRTGYDLTQTVTSPTDIFRGTRLKLGKAILWTELWVPARQSAKVWNGCNELPRRRPRYSSRERLAPVRNW